MYRYLYTTFRPKPNMFNKHAKCFLVCKKHFIINENNLKDQEYNSKTDLLIKQPCDLDVFKGIKII